MTRLVAAVKLPHSAVKATLDKRGESLLFGAYSEVEEIDIATATTVAKTRYTTQHQELTHINVFENGVRLFISHTTYVEAHAYLQLHDNTIVQLLKVPRYAQCNDRFLVTKVTASLFCTRGPFMVADLDSGKKVVVVDDIDSTTNKMFVTDNDVLIIDVGQRCYFYELPSGCLLKQTEMGLWNEVIRVLDNDLLLAFSRRAKHDEIAIYDWARETKISHVHIKDACLQSFQSSNCTVLCYQGSTYIVLYIDANRNLLPLFQLQLTGFCSFGNLKCSFERILMYDDHDNVLVYDYRPDFALLRDLVLVFHKQLPPYVLLHIYDCYASIDKECIGSLDTITSFYHKEKVVAIQRVLTAIQDRHRLTTSSPNARWRWWNTVTEKKRAKHQLTIGYLSWRLRLREWYCRVMFYLRWRILFDQDQGLLY